LKIEEEIMSEPGSADREDEKRDEKGAFEKQRSDPIGAISWAAFLIWAGVILLLNNLGKLDVLTDFLDRIGVPGVDLPFHIPFVDFDAWQVFFLGAGVIVIIEIIIRLVMPIYRGPIIGNIIWAAILFGLALGSWNVIWPLVVITIGVVVLLGGIFRRR
jgi:hypothetical protein